MKFCKIIHWSTGNVFQPVSTSYACQLNFMGANSTSWEAYKDLSFFATYWMERNSFFARCEIQMIHWSTGKVFRPVSTSYACQLNFLGSIQGFILRWTAPVSTSYACQLNFLGRIYPSLRPIEWKEIPSLLDIKLKCVCVCVSVCLCVCLCVRI